MSPFYVELIVTLASFDINNVIVLSRFLPQNNLQIVRQYMRNIVYSLLQPLPYRVIDRYIIDAAFLQFLPDSQNHIDYLHFLFPLNPRFQILFNVYYYINQHRLSVT